MFKHYDAAFGVSESNGTGFMVSLSSAVWCEDGNSKTIRLRKPCTDSDVLPSSSQARRVQMAYQILLTQMERNASSEYLQDVPWIDIIKGRWPLVQDVEGMQSAVIKR